MTNLTEITNCLIDCMKKKNQTLTIKGDLINSSVYLLQAMGIL